MPSRTALLELATRRNSHVCRSCLTALGLSKPPQRFARGYTRTSKKDQRFSSHLEKSETRAAPTRFSSKGSEHRRGHVERPGGPDTAENTSLWPEAGLEADTPPDVSFGKRPRINYFEKDPKTGEVTPIPDIEDDGEDEPDFEDIAQLGRGMLDKVKTLDATLRKADQLDGLLEKLLRKHGPPGALEATQAALNSYDEPNENEPPNDLNVEDDSDPDANIANVMRSLTQALSESKFADTPELKDTVTVFHDALKSLNDASPSEAGVGKAIDDDFDRVSKPYAFRSIALRDYDTLPSITFREQGLDGTKLQQLKRQAYLLESRLRASVAAIGKSETIRKSFDDATGLAFDKFMKGVSVPHTEVPKGIWSALWTIFSHDGPSNSFKWWRIHSLSRAMTKFGAPLSGKQQVLAIESAFQKSEVLIALDWWKSKVTVLGEQGTRTALDFWSLGVRMWCAVGEIERAERACKNLLERSTPSNPADSRVLLHLTEAYCTKPETAEKGFLFYRRMRDLALELNKPLEIQDYDDVISLFLHTGHTDYAMFAFTDMMFAGTVNLYGKSKLPSTVRNKFFFGKWLKRLIGEGDLDGAYKVLVFMQQNGVMAAPIQVNGLIGAWLRTGTVTNRNKAYSLAWAMIRSRQTFVDLRKREALLEWPMRLWDNRPNALGHKGKPEMDYGLVPMASIETFVILAGEYRARSMIMRLEELFVAYKQCEMPGDAMMMNELIAAAVANRQGEKARELYKLMVHEYDILPSTDTFAILFSSIPVNLSRVPLSNKYAIAQSIREARAIFADMMRSMWVYEGKPGRRTLSEGQAKLILHSFRKTGDWAGISAALMGLRDVMKYQLTRGVVLEMIAGVEAMNKPSNRTAKVVLRTTMRLQSLVEDMLREGKLPASSTGKSMKDWKTMYNILLSFYETKLQESSRQKQAKLIEKAKEDMGLAKITMTMPMSTDVD